MVKLLDQYKEKKAEYCTKIGSNSFHLDCLLEMQELNYRICVLEAFKFYGQTAPVSMETKDLGMHFQQLDAFIRFLGNERKLGNKVNEDGQKKRALAAESLQSVIQDGRRRFDGYKPAIKEQYKKDLQALIATILPVWIQYRNTYVKI